MEGRGVETVRGEREGQAAARGCSSEYGWNIVTGYEGINKERNPGQLLARFRRTSDGDLIPGPEQGFDIVGGYFSANRKSFLFHSSNMHFHITKSSIAFLKKKVIFLC